MLVALGCLLLAFGLVPRGAEGQPSTRCEASRRVRSVDFSGSPHFPDDTLAAAIVTHAPGTFARITRAFGIGTVPCADSLEVEADAIRIAVMHRRAGWFLATVTPRFARSPEGVRVRFDVIPGPPAILDSLRITGLPPDSLAPRVGRALERLRAERFDRGRVENAIAATLDALHDAGYARAARPANTIAIDTALARVTLSLSFATGPQLRIGAVRVDVEGAGRDGPHIDSAAVVRLIALRPGQRYDASAILAAQRDLYRSEAFRLVLVDTLSVAPAVADSLIGLRIEVAEARTRYARAGVGWATQDCMRAQGRIADRTFLGVGRRAELNVRASKIGVGAPADFAPNLCSYSVRTDTFSTKLNYYTALSLSDVRLFGARLSPVLSVYSERRSEQFTYLRETTIGALLQLSRPLGIRTTVSGGAQYENGRTETSPVISCSLFGQCRPEDYESSFFGRGIGVLSGTITHDRTGGASNPSRGQRLRGELRAGQTDAQRASASVRFVRGTAEGASFTRFLGGVVATRLLLSQAFAPGTQLVDGSLLPQQERLFGGGQNTVRGFQQNLLGPLVYVVSAVDTIRRDGGLVVEADPAGPKAGRVRPVPRGGTALAIANLEYRRTLGGISEQLQAVAFVDIGNVWEGPAGGFRSRDLRLTPGGGFRLVTPLGPFRVDVGYSPYPPRAGRALFLTSGTIRCASPGNTVYIDRANADVFDCPETYVPKARSVLGRLVFHFGLGQAF